LGEALGGFGGPEPEAHAALLAPGDVLDGGYRIVELVGQGAYGRVYRAQHPTLEREVAVKLLTDAAGTRRQRFVREGRIVAGLSHPAIGQVFATGEHAAHPYLVYELIEGARDLEQAAEGWSRERRLQALLEVADGVAHAHAEGVIHRDLKPSNVIVDGEQRCRVIDFGLAKAEDDAEKLTVSGAMIGTPAYMSPEAFRSEALGPEADVWSLGVILYRLLTERLPFDGETLQQLAERIASPLVPPHELDPTLAEALSAVCVRALSREPGDRYPHAGAFAAALRAALGGATGADGASGASPGSGGATRAGSASGGSPGRGGATRAGSASGGSPGNGGATRAGSASGGSPGSGGATRAGGASGRSGRGGATRAGGASGRPGGDARRSGGDPNPSSGPTLGLAVAVALALALLGLGGVGLLVWGRVGADAPPPPPAEELSPEGALRAAAEGAAAGGDPRPGLRAALARWPEAELGCALAVAELERGDAFAARDALGAERARWPDDPRARALTQLVEGLLIPPFAPGRVDALREAAPAAVNAWLEGECRRDLALWRWRRDPRSVARLPRPRSALDELRAKLEALASWGDPRQVTWAREGQALLDSDPPELARLLAKLKLDEPAAASQGELARLLAELKLDDSTRSALEARRAWASEAQVRRVLLGEAEDPALALADVIEADPWCWHAQGRLAMRDEADALPAVLEAAGWDPFLDGALHPWARQLLARDPDALDAFRERAGSGWRSREALALLEVWAVEHAGRSQRLAAALEGCEALLAERPGAILLRLARAFLLVRSGRLAAADAELRRLEAWAPEAAHTWVYRALWHARRGADEADVLAALRQALALGFLAELPAHAALSDYPELAPYARWLEPGALEPAPRVDPYAVFAQAALRAGDAHAGSGRHPEALEAYEVALELVRERAPVLVKCGVALDGLGRDEEALQSFARAQVADPDYGPAFSRRAEQLRRLERYEEAAGDYTRALELDPRDPRLLLYRGWCLAQLERLEQALADYDRSLEGHTLAVTHLMRARTRARLDRLEAALADYDRALELGLAASLTEDAQRERAEVRERLGQ